MNFQKSNFYDGQRKDFNKMVFTKEPQTLHGYKTLPPIAEEMGDLRLGGPGDPRVREDTSGHLLCWGCGEFGQHGHGSSREVTFQMGAVEMFCGDPATRARHVACGASHTAVVTNNNELYLWGNGNSGQLGSNDRNTRLAPHKVSLFANQASPPPIAGVSCGGRHTMVWLDNGHVFCFGNNFHAQLGYDFRQKNYKENQNFADGFWDEDDENTEQYATQPILLKSLSHRPVVQLACGDKHTVFRFRDGAVACVGNNAHGQIGTGIRDDILLPKSMDVFKQPTIDIAAGSQHTMAVTDAGEIYVWGFGKACGSRKNDVLSPVKLVTSRRNIVSVAGGSSHSMALTANGSVYTWGCGHDGQLGHGENVRFLVSPKRVRDRHVAYKCIQIQCGEAFSATITEKGLLYMWGKNSHTIIPDKPTTHKVYLPHGVNKNFRGGRLEKVFCGSWHTVALIGRPELLIRDGDESGESDTEHIPTPEEVDAIDDSEEFRSDMEGGTDDLNNNEMALPDLDTAGSQGKHDNELASSRMSRRETSRLEREKTSVSLADFYAPTPDIKYPRSPSPELYTTNGITGDGEEEVKTDRAAPSTARSATLVVQLPVQPLTTYADAACSPMTLTTTSGSNKSSSVVTSLSRVASPIAEINTYRTNSRANRGILKPDKKMKQFDPIKFEKEKLKIVTSPVISEIVQISKTTADAYVLPRETTGLAKKHVDFSEMEEIRLKGPSRSPDKLSRASKHKDRRDTSPFKFRDLSPGKHKEPPNSRASRLRYIDSSMSFKSDSVLMESPLFKSSAANRSVSTTEQTKKPWNSNTPDDDRPYRHHVPKHKPRQYKHTKNADSNFALQISRSKTLVTQLQGGAFESPDRLAQLRRYAAIHNPHSTSSRGINEKLKPIKTRHVSIPTGRVDSPVDDADQLFIGTLETQHRPVYGAEPALKDRTTKDKLYTQRKVAGIVKMYLGTGDVVGAVESPLYSTISDGRGHADSLMDKDPFIVQPLLKKRISKLADDIPQLPEINNTHNLKVSLKETSRRSESKMQIENEGLDPSFCITSRTEMVDSRIS